MTQADIATPTHSPEKPREARAAPPSGQDSMPSRYPAGVRALCMVAFAYVVFAYINGRLLHWFEGPDGEAPIWLSHWTEYGVIVAFGVWRTLSERNPHTRRRLAFLTVAVGILYWVFPAYLRIPEPYVGTLPGQPFLPQLHTPGTLTFFATLLLVFLFGRRLICGWNCPCVGIRETVGFAFRTDTPRSDRAWRWRHLKWFFFVLYMIVFALIVIPGSPYVSPIYRGFLALLVVPYFATLLLSPLIGNRSWCRFGCPYAATFSLLNKVGFFGVAMDRDRCIDCRRCEQVCDMVIPIWKQGKATGRITAIEECMGCGRCIVSCPTDALEFRDIRNRFLPNLRMNGSHLLWRSEPPALPPRIEAPMRPASERKADWHEDLRPLTLEAAVAAAGRCIDCGVPGCRNACPLENRIPEWLEALAAEKVEAAAAILHTTSNFPEICGTVCPQHRLCEGGCTLEAAGGPVTIGALERFVISEALQRGWRPPPPIARANGKTAAMIGAGPAGMACADELNKAGFQVTVYDKRGEAGGMLAYGAPSFRLDKSIVVGRRALLQDAGVRFEFGVEVDETTMDRLVQSNDAVFLGMGAQASRPAELPGRALAGVFDGLSYLFAVNADSLGESASSPEMRGKRVLVLGGGDTAIDSARSAVRQEAASVTVAYRRGPEKMRASPEEVALASEEGVGFAYHKAPLEFVGTGSVEGVRFAADNGRGGETLPCDVAIVAIGMLAAPPDWLGRLGIATDAGGLIEVDDSGRTTNPKVFAGGDNTHGPDLVVTAVAAGRRASRGILSATSG